MPSPRSLNPNEETPESNDPDDRVDRNVVEMDDAPGPVLAHDEDEEASEGHARRPS